MERFELKRLREDLPERLKGYPHSSPTAKLGFEGVINILEGFLQNEGVIIFSEMDELSGYKLQEVALFNGKEELLDFMRKNISYGHDNYYVAPRDLGWLLLICHEEDLHLYW